MKAYVVHLKNKYPQSQIKSSENSIDVFSQAGDHLISLERNAHGQWVDRSEDLGCFEKFSLAPIPKEARCFKLYANGMIGKAEEFEDRKKFVAENAIDCGGYKKILGVGEKSPEVIVTVSRKKK